MFVFFFMNCSFKADNSFQCSNFFFITFKQITKTQKKVIINQSNKFVPFYYT